MAYPRSRSKRQGRIEGDYQTIVYGTPYPPTLYFDHALKQDTDDVVGSRETINPFYSVKREIEGSVVNFTGSDPDILRIVRNCPSTFYGDWAPLGLTHPSSDDELLARLKSRGPLTPRVNLPLFLYELKDIPGMLRHAGDLLHKIKRPSGLDPVAETAAANLAYKFGWDPLISDLNSMLKFSSLVRNRQNELKRAASEKGLRVKVKLDTVHATYPQFSWPVWSTYVWLDATVDTIETVESWGTMRWKLKPGLDFGRDPSYMDAFRSVYGLNAGDIPVAIWKGLPWSWAIDWFFDLSSALQASHNMIYYTPYSACRMTRTTTKWTHPEIRDSNFRLLLSEGRKTRTFMTRRSLSIPTSNIPTLKLPFLDDFKLSILGSLTALKLKGAAKRR